MEQFSAKQQRDLKVLIDFVRLYCRARHAGQEAVTLPPELAVAGKGLALCPDCVGLLLHGIERRRRCPLDPKPTCKNCRIHCYSRDYRAKIREIMAFSGRRMLMRGRLDYLWHYFF